MKDHISSISNISNLRQHINKVAKLPITKKVDPAREGSRARLLFSHGGRLCIHVPHKGSDNGNNSNRNGILSKQSQEMIINATIKEKNYRANSLVL